MQEEKIVPDFKGFVLHVEEWNKNNVAYCMNDLRELAKKYNCPVPDEWRERK